MFQRPYLAIQSSIFRSRLKRLVVIVWLLGISSLSFAQTPSTSVGTDALEHALDYFTSGKYHEALLLFKQLNKQYKLNPRFKAYTALCYYHEWDYKEAAKWFDENIPQLEGLAPSELSVYCYAAAESYFNLNEYAKAIPYYVKTLSVCYPRDRADNYYRLGFCYYLLHQNMSAQSYFMLADYYYTQFRNNDDTQSRRAQISRMVKGLSTDALRILSEHHALSRSLQRNEGRESSEANNSTTQ